ncbi:DUF1740-domain-containing protein [Peniophora sp. CONT]|nr:DUF1740-domain-containing protein [Peniophora sp. CONT]
MTAPPSFKSFAAPSFSSFPDLDAPKAGPSSQKLDDDVYVKEKKSKKDDKGSRRDKDGKEKRSRRDEKDRSGRRRSRERDEDRDRPRRRSKERDSERKDRHHRSHRDERPRDHDERKRHKDEDPFASDERIKAIQDTKLRSSYSDPFDKPIFYSDKRGDPANVHYGRLDSKYVPDYRHVAGGRFVLGLANGLMVLYRGSKGVEVGKRSSGGLRKVAGLTDASSRAMLKAPPTHRLIPSERTLKKYEPDVNGTIRLSRRSAKSQDEPEYRAIEPVKDEYVSSEDEAEASEESGDDEDATPVTAYQERLLALQRATNESPAFAEGWTALLEHMLSQVPLSSRGAVKARAEITLSVLERALRTVPSNKATPLRLLYFQAGEEVWELKELQEKWAMAMESEDANADIRAAWFEWRIRRAEGGLDGVLEDATKTIDAAGKNEMEKLRLFWRVAVLLRQSGFTERALAMFQAQAELTYNCPPSFVGAFLTSRLDKLEEFWESEAPRIGEQGAQGWAAWLSAGKPVHNVPNGAAPVVPPLSSGDAYQQWAHHETASDRVVRPALRMMDPAAEEDPYSMVMFADVRPFLFTLSSQRARSAYRLAWLSLLGLHVPGFETSLDPQSSRATMDDTWAMQHLCAPARLDALFPSSTSQRAGEADAHAGVLIGPEEHYAPSFGPVKNWAYRGLGPLEGMDFPPPPGARWALWDTCDVADVDVTLARNIFAACRTGTDDVEWDALTLCFEAAVSNKSALKLSRSFLASAQDSLPRWAVHARLERLRGRTIDARKVYETVLLSPTAEQNRLGTGILWWDWAEMEWLAGDDAAARRVVLRAAGVVGEGGVQVLRAKRALAETASSVPTPLWKAREAWARLGALLELLTGSGLSPVVDIPTGGNAVAAESAAVAGLSLRYHDVVSRRGRAGDLRERLEEAVSAFPDNTALLGMHLEMQKGRGVWSRARDVVQGGGVARRVAEVWATGQVPTRWAWEVERARVGLSEAVADERTRGSAVLWRVWLALEVRAGNLKRAKEVLIRAVAACPLVKELYLPAFGALRLAFSVFELNRLAETMAERGIRMRRVLEEAMEIEEGEDESGSGEDDEIEADSKEYSRLKPYAGPY